MGFKKEKNYSDLNRFSRDKSDNKINEKTNVLIIWETWSWKTKLLNDILKEKNDTIKIIFELKDQKYDNFSNTEKDLENNTLLYRVNTNSADYLNNFIFILRLIKKMKWDKVIIFDEFHLFIKNKDLKNEINLLLREARNNNISVIIATQEQEEKLVEYWIVNHFAEVIKL